jgi:hypothetical protein
MILPLNPWREENHASHGLYLDTPPLKGNCTGTWVPVGELLRNDRRGYLRFPQSNRLGV